MKKAILLLILAPLVGSAQQNTAVSLSINPQLATGADPSIYISAEDIARQIAKAEAETKQGAPVYGRAPMLVQPPITMSVEFIRGAIPEFTLHESSAELFVVIGGTGTMTLGSKLIDPIRTGLSMSAAKAEGGTHYRLHKGDILLVPANTARAVTRTEGKLEMMSVEIPIGPPNLWPAGNGFFASIGDQNIYISAEEIADRMAKADAALKAGLPDRGPFSLLWQPPYKVTMDDRMIPNGHVDAHGVTAELFIVLDGSGTIVVGGQLINPKGQGNDLTAASTEGGALYKVRKGDVILVPVNAAHAVTQVDGKMAMMQVHIPAAADHK